VQKCGPWFFFWLFPSLLMRFDWAIGVLFCPFSPSCQLSLIGCFPSSSFGWLRKRSPLHGPPVHRSPKSAFHRTSEKPLPAFPSFFFFFFPHKSGLPCLTHTGPFQKTVLANRDKPPTFFIFSLFRFLFWSWVCLGCSNLLVGFSGFLQKKSTPSFCFPSPSAFFFFPLPWLADCFCSDPTFKGYKGGGWHTFGCIFGKPKKPPTPPGPNRKKLFLRFLIGFHCVRNFTRSEKTTTKDFPNFFPPSIISN